MATWFAQTNNGNINAANMWNSNPAGGGTVLTWPPSSSDILVLNGKTVLGNVGFTVAQVVNDARDGATSGGQLQPNTSGITITADFYNTGVTNGTGILRCIVYSGSLNVVGNLYGGSASNTLCFFTPNSGTTTVNFTGNVYGGSGTSAWGLYSSGTHNGTINATGIIYANDVSTTVGARVSHVGVLSHTGNVIARVGTAMQIISAATVNITGNVTGGNSSTAYGVSNESTGTTTITGNALASSGSSIRNLVAGVVTVTGYAEAATNQPAITNNDQGVVTVGETRSASNGRGAVLGAFRYASATSAKSLPIIAGSQQTLSVLNVAALVPAVENVRAGVVYGSGAYTGTLPLNRKRTSMAGRF